MKDINFEKEEIKEKISSGILFVKNDKILLCHVTDLRHWDIPKGQRDEGESFLEAAVRECKEETGFIVKEEDLHPLGITAYNRYKSLALYLYTGDSFPEENKCRCTSLLENGKPEVDGFKYIPLKEVSLYTVESLRKAIYKTLSKFYPDEMVEEKLDTRKARINYQN